MKLIREDLLEQKNKDRIARRTSLYKRNANLDDDVNLTEDMLDNWALERTACFSNCSVESLKEDLLHDSLLTEETIKDLADKLDEPIIAKNVGAIELALDKALKVARREKREGGDQWPSILLIGEAGVGKTARTKAWAKENGINLVEKAASTMDDTDLGGAVVPNRELTQTIKLSTSEFDSLNKPDSVLFLDEFNRAPKTVRGTFLTLINDHRIPGGKEFPNLLFVIAAVNPWSNDYDTDELDAAERDRFWEINVPSEPRSWINWFNRTIDALIKQELEAGDLEAAKENEGRKGIANALINSKAFEFDTAQDREKSKEKGNGKTLSQRSLTKLLKLSDGTKDNFLELWDGNVNSLKKLVAKQILANYKDVDDKANDALKADTDSEVFKKQETNFDKLNKHLGGIL